MELRQKFETAVADSKTLAEKPSNIILLELYGLYKQATAGDAGADAPANPFDIVAKAKFEAWAGHRGKNEELAMQQYISLVDKLKTEG